MRRFERSEEPGDEVREREKKMRDKRMRVEGREREGRRKKREEVADSNHFITIDYLKAVL